jgi:hypothetical protein
MSVFALIASLPVMIVAFPLVSAVVFSFAATLTEPRLEKNRRPSETGIRQSLTRISDIGEIAHQT